MLKVGNYRIHMISLFSFFLYIAMSDLFGLVDFSLFVPGELYDFLVICLLLTTVIMTRKWRKDIPATFSLLWPFYALTAIGILQGCLLYFTDVQSIGHSLSVIRELLFLVIIFPYLQLEYDPHKVIRIFVVLDTIAAIVYITEIIYGGPVTGTVHALGIYENMGGMKIWRSWSHSPLYITFTASYLFLHILKGKKVFSTRAKDIMSFCLIVLAAIARLNRTELFCVILSCILSILIADGSNYKRKIIHAAGIAITAVLGGGLLFTIFPGVYRRMANGVADLVNFSNGLGSTLSIRVFAFKTRMDYILSNGKALFGVGPLHRDYRLPGLEVNIHDSANNRILSSDNAYATFLIRYGVVGLALFILGIVLLSRRFIGCRYIWAIPFGLSVFVTLINAYFGYEVWGKQGVLSICILAGIYLKILQQEEFKGNKI